MFKTSKSVLMDFSQSKTITQSLMVLQGTNLVPQPTHKFLGVMLDQELQWNHQANYAIAKASKWTLAAQQLAWPSNGV